MLIWGVESLPLSPVVKLNVDEQLTCEVVLGKDCISYYREYLISEGVMSPISPQNEQQLENEGVLLTTMIKIWRKTKLIPLLKYSRY